MKQTVTDLIIRALESAKDAGELSLEVMPEVLVEVPKDTGHGDFATTVALGLARSEKKPPRAIAQAIISHIKDEGGSFDKIEIAGPGFINFYLLPAAWLDVIRDVERQGRSFGHSHIGGGRKVQVEFVSANPTGPLHIGHGRGAAVGDSLARLLSFAGFDVRREFYINDYGSQVDNLGKSIYTRYLQLTGADMGPELVAEPSAKAAGDDDDGGAGGGASDLYQGEYITEVARVFMEDPGFESLGGEAKRQYCREEGMKIMLEQIAATLEGYGITFDEWFSERSLYGPENDQVEEAISFLRDKGLVYEEGGALWISTTKFGDDKDRVVVRNNGQTTYFASDIAYHRNKFERGFEEVIDVWGADHHGYVPRMKAAVAALGHDPDAFRVLLVQLVSLAREGKPVKMSKRAGEFVTLSEVIEEVGTDACRFTFMLRRCDSHLDFDLDLVKRQTAENPVYYVQYAHARLCSVFEQAKDRGLELPPITGVDLGRLTLDEEVSLIRKLSAFPELVEGAAVAHEPHRLTYYLQELASELHSYYFKHRIITDDESLSFARMYLVKAVRTVIATALGLLGVNAPEKM